MQKQNVGEYNAIRADLANLRDCTTTYVGFVVLGAGSTTAFFAHEAFGRSPVLIGFAVILICILSILILFVLSYKFTSHNRYAGYSKLLTQERFGKDPKLPTEDIFLWEVCVDRVRTFESGKHPWEGPSGNLAALLEERGASLECPELTEGDRLSKVVAHYSGTSIDRHGWLFGWALVFTWPQVKIDEGKGAAGHLGWGRAATRSWHFPLYIARIFLAIDAAFLALAWILLRPHLKWSIHSWPTILAGASFCVVGGMWFGFVSKLYRQMIGSETVEAFCWKFVPVHAVFLADHCKAAGARLAYSLIGAQTGRPTKGASLKIAG